MTFIHGVILRGSSVGRKKGYAANMSPEGYIMIDARVSEALLFAIHFGKMIASSVSFTAFWVEWHDDNASGPEADKKTEMLGKDLIKRYVFFYKLRRRAFRIMEMVYPEAFGEGTNKHKDVKMLAMRMEETAGKLDEAMSKHLKRIVNGDSLQQFAVLRWRNKPNPPALIELEMVRWAHHEVSEDVKLAFYRWDNMLKRKKKDH